MVNKEQSQTMKGAHIFLSSSWAKTLLKRNWIHILHIFLKKVFFYFFFIVDVSNEIGHIFHMHSVLIFLSKYSLDDERML